MTLLHKCPVSGQPGRVHAATDSWQVAPSAQVQSVSLQS